MVPGNFMENALSTLTATRPSRPQDLTPHTHQFNQRTSHSSFNSRATMPQKKDLTTLPMDLHVFILAFLDSYDILQTRKTCKVLHGATLQRIVWIEALRQVCRRNSIYEGTFPLSKMSLSELEHAATVPSRWASLSSKPPKKKDDPLPYIASRRLHCPRSIAYDLDEELGDFSSFYLVPGGRYLVTFSWNWIAIWDLGLKPGPDTIIGFQPLGVSAVHFTGMSLVHPTPDGRGLRIFISAAEQTLYKQTCYESSVFLIYEIYPQSFNPQLELIARLDPIATDDISFYSLSSNRLIFLEGSVMKIWDYKQDSWASWTVEQDYDQIIVGESTITLLCHTGVAVWPIPTLSTSSPPFPDPNPPISKPHLTLPYPTPSPTRTAWCEGPCDWFSGTSQPFLYDLVNWEREDRIVKMRRYEVVLSQDLKSSELIERRAFAFHGPDESDILIQPSAFYDDSLVSVFFDSISNSIKIHTGSTLARDGNGTPELESSDAMTLVTGEQITRGYAMGFCPISARLLYLDSEMNICILDYMPRPTKEVSWLDIQRGGCDNLAEDAVLELVEPPSSV